MRAQDWYAEAYGAAADGYARVLDPTLEPILRRLVEVAEVRPGSRVLDLATGTGAAARIAAAAGAEVTGVDISPGMIELARQLSPAGLRFHAADAAELPFSAGAFSVVICGFGLSHFPDLSATLAEIRRVLASGGLFVECSWASEGSSPAFSAAVRLLEEVSGGELHAFAGILDEGTWANIDRGGSALREAGFENVGALTESFAGAYRDATDALAWALAWPDYGQTFAKLDAPAQADYQQRACEAIDQAADLSWEFAINYYRARP